MTGMAAATVPKRGETTQMDGKEDHSRAYLNRVRRLY
jgi:hypothetical protein